jgi:predicted ATP-grasp superfamily ATP-dependent carboligase
MEIMKIPLKQKAIIINATGLGYQVIRALSEKGVQSIVIYDRESEELGRYSRYVAESVMIPGFIEEPHRLLDHLLKKASEWSGSLIIPTKDYGVEFLAGHKAILSQHYIIPVPDGNVIAGILNKRTLYGNLRKRGISVPKTFHPRSVDELNKLRDEITFPCLLKPGLAHLFLRKFGFKMLEIHNFDDLVSNYRNVTDDFTSDRFKMMICDIIPGPDSKQMIQYVSYIDRSGELLASMTSRKMRQDPPRYGQGRVARSEKIAGVDELSYSLLRDLGFYGFSETEWKYDPRDNRYKLIEINPRFIFYLGLCVASGINFPYIMYADFVLNKKVRVDSFRENVYWIHEYKDVLHTVLNHKMESLSLWDYVRPYLGRKSFAIFDLKDPRPFFEQLREHADNLLRRRFCSR